MEIWNFYKNTKLYLKVGLSLFFGFVPLKCPQNSLYSKGSIQINGGGGKDGYFFNIIRITR